MAKDGRWIPRGSKPGDSSADGAASAPIDIAAVRHDDALIEAIASGSEFECADADERHIAALFTEWRAQIVTPALPESPDLDVVAAEVDEAIKSRRYRQASLQGLRLLRPVMSAAAVLAIVVGGLSVFSYNAAPGDPLWGVKEVVFKEQAESTVAQIDTNAQLLEVEQAIASSDAPQAVSALSEAAKIAKEVKNEELHDQLMTKVTEYLSMVQSTFPNIPITDFPTVPPGTTPPTTNPPTTDDGATTNNPQPGTTDPTEPSTTDPTTTNPTTSPTSSSPETTTTSQGTTPSDTNAPVGAPEPGTVSGGTSKTTHS